MTTPKSTTAKPKSVKPASKPTKARTPRIPPQKSAGVTSSVTATPVSEATDADMSNPASPTTFSSTESPLASVTSDDQDLPEFKKQELFAKVADRTGIKKKIAKPVIEAAMEALGDALAEGRNVNIPGLGKIKQNRIKEHVKARVIIAKIRQPKPQPDTGYEPLADAAE